MKTFENNLTLTSQQDPQLKYKDTNSVTYKYRCADFQTLLLASIAESQNSTRSGSIELNTLKMAPPLLQTIKNAVADELAKND